MRVTAQTDKDELRCEMQDRLRGMTELEISNESEAAQQRLLGMSEFVDAGVVCCYLNMKLEVATSALVARRIEMGRVLTVPSYQDETRSYDIVQLDDPSTLVEGKFGISEPGLGSSTFTGSVDLIVVPGLGFDRTGNRLGRGGGYYDRMLADDRFLGAVKVGIAFNCQIIDSVPVLEHDVGIDVLITEERLYRCS